jgi:hypothetical protein
VEVLIDTVGQYSVKIVYRVDFYASGQGSLIGNWRGLARSTNTYGNNVTFTETAINFNIKRNDYSELGAESPFVDLTDLLTLNATVKATTTVHFGVTRQVWSNSDSVPSDFKCVSSHPTEGESRTVSLDVSDLDGEYYILIFTAGADKYPTTYYAYDIWGE